jgi:hypothetical protein
MKVLSKEKIKVLAERYGWSPAFAEGFLDGESYRRRGTPPTTYFQVGLDEYCLGFRAGYYERSRPSPAGSGSPDVLVRMQRNAARR